MKTESGSDLNLIAAGTVFEGKLKASGSIRVDGRIVCEVEIPDGARAGDSLTAGSGVAEG